MSNLNAVRKYIENNDFKNFRKILIKKKININNYDSFGFSIIHWIAFYNKIDFFKELEKLKIPINYSIPSKLSIFQEKILHENNTTPLICASKELNVNMVKYLLENGVNPNEIDSSGASSLFRVTERLEFENKLDDCCEIMKLLLDKGADVENKEYFFTPLCMSIGFTSMRPIELLLKYGAKIDTSNMVKRYLKGSISPIYAICDMKKIIKFLKFGNMDHTKESDLYLRDKISTDRFPPDIEIVKLFMTYDPEFFRKLFKKERSTLTEQETVIIKFIEINILKDLGEGLGE